MCANAAKTAIVLLVEDDPGDPALTRRAFENGKIVNSYITKPVDMQDFIDVVSELGNYWFQVVALPTRCGE